MENTIVPITKAAHANTKIRTDVGYPHAHRMHMCGVSIREMDSVISNYPVTFVKDGSDGRFNAVAIFGLAEGENVFVLHSQGKSAWNATYVPQLIQRYPLSIGMSEDKGVLDENMPICIDESSSLVNTETGEALLDENGEASPYLLTMQQILADLYHGERDTKSCIQQLDEKGVLTELRIVFTKKSGKTHTLQGLYAADRQRIMELGAADAHSLTKTGAMMLACAQASSLSQLTRIIQLKNINNPDPILDVKVEHEGVEG